MVFAFVSIAGKEANMDMNLTLGKDFKLSLGKSKQLQYAMKLLELPSGDLRDEIEAERERNPLLEVDDNRPEPDARDLPTTPVRGAAETEPDDAESFAVAAIDIGGKNLTAIDAPLHQRMFATTSAEGGVTDVFEKLHSRPTNLQTHLIGQLMIAGLSSDERKIAEALIYRVDDNGYLDGDPIKIAETEGVSLDKVLQILAVVQGMEPTGVAARSVAECLSLQLRERGWLTPAMQLLMENLNRLLTHGIDHLGVKCRVSSDEIRNMLAELSQLNPKPGLAFCSEMPELITPDVFARKNADGRWQVEFNSHAMPTVRTNKTYYIQLAKQKLVSEDRRFLSRSFKDAKALERSLLGRETIIVEVAREIVARQRAFFEHGVQHLKPMTLKMVAKTIGVNESTVSRATTQKYIETPMGLFELKYFFTNGIASNKSEEMISTKAIRDLIFQLVRSEGDTILSDDAIAEALSEGGIDIARRTVSKYRSDLKIPSSFERGRLKALVKPAQPEITE
jgi:RNA polymerase sigma-54 factor